MPLIKGRYLLLYLSTTTTTQLKNIGKENIKLRNFFYPKQGIQNFNRMNDNDRNPNLNFGIVTEEQKFRNIESFRIKRCRSISLFPRIQR